MVVAVPGCRSMAICARRRAWATHGRRAEAVAGIRELGLSVDDELSYLREFAHITLARVLLADGHRRAALGLLERLRTAAEQGGRTGNLIEILVLQALAHGDTAAALVPLEHALALAEPEHYVRVFVDAGPPMTALLKAVARRHKNSAYFRRLLAACGGAPRAQAPALVDPLSERELDVLRLVATDLDGRHSAPAERPPEHRAYPHQEHLRQTRAVGCAVTPRTRMRRLAGSITARMYIRAPVGVTVSKSAASSACAWERTKSVQVLTARSGAGSIPASRRISPMVDGATLIPSVSSSPYTLRYPQLAFSFARRSTKAQIERSVRGRPRRRSPRCCGVAAGDQVTVPFEDRVGPDEQPQTP
jgi:hypothetical protein